MLPPLHQGQHDFMYRLNELVTLINFLSVPGSVLDTDTFTAAGLGPAIDISTITDTFSITFGPSVGVTSAGIQIEDAATAVPLGYVWFPEGSGQRVARPSGTSHIKLNVISFVGTGTLSVNVGY